jgi:hypothetical protein
MQISDLLGPNLNLDSVLAQAEKMQTNLNAIVADRQTKVAILGDDIKSIQSVQLGLKIEGEKAGRIAKRFKDLLE